MQETALLHGGPPPPGPRPRAPAPPRAPLVSLVVCQLRDELYRIYDARGAPRSAHSSLVSFDRRQTGEISVK
ncbi:unnamed protein product [Leptidea sinapis]|uniref:Uncharacterized protein n=1 Tax=Leptidea sinapis TaxID=189913 RepID=A0A5E4QG37_9NEOP|nr:unnamed protein product [Leptidea sinapis]